MLLHNGPASSDSIHLQSYISNPISHSSHHPISSLPPPHPDLFLFSLSCIMEFNGKRALWSFLEEEEKKSIQSPTHLSLKTHQQLLELDPQFNTTRPCSASMIPPFPSSPDSPWMLSPIHTSPSPYLLYHCIASVHRGEGNIFSVAISRGIIFTSSESRHIRVWRQPECVERGYIKASFGEVHVILAYGNLLFSTHGDYKVRVWNFSVSENFRSKKITTLPKQSSCLLFPRRSTQKHKDFVSCLAYYHEEGLLYTGSWDKTVKAWRMSDKRCVDSFVAHEDNVNAIVVNQGDGCVFTCSSDGSIKLWRRVYEESSHTLTMTLKFNPSPVNALALSSWPQNSCFLYSGSSDGFINFWEKEKMSSRFNHGGFLQGHRFAVLCLVAITNLVFSGSEDSTIRVWRREEEEESYFHTCLAVLDGHRGPVRCLAACLETENVVMGFLVYSTSLDQTFKVWRVKVFPGEKKVINLEDTEKSDQKTKILECQMSPVLSPSWVESKLQCNHFQ